MSIYLQATLEVRPGELERLFATLARIKPIVGEAGWEMIGCFQQRTGRLNTVIDLWRMEDMNSFERGLRTLTAAPDFPELQVALAAALEGETLVFLDRVDLDARV